jgi:hypothetical protein
MIASHFEIQVFFRSADCQSANTNYRDTRFFCQNSIAGLAEKSKRFHGEYHFQVNLAILPNRIQVSHRIMCAGTHAVFLSLNERLELNVLKVGNYSGKIIEPESGGMTCKPGACFRHRFFCF